MHEDDELTALRRDLGRHRRRGGRYPEALTTRAGAWVRGRRARGDWWCDVSRALGVPTPTLQRWARRAAAQGPVALRAVHVIDAPPPGTVTLVTASGLRIEDVALDDAVVILQRLA